LYKHDPEVFVKNYALLSEFVEICNVTSIPVSLLTEDLSKHSYLLPDLIFAACNRIASLPKLASVVEECTEIHFMVSANWKVIIFKLQVPELSEIEYLHYCIEHCLILTIYTYSVQQLTRLADNKEEKLAFLDKLISWSMKELNPSKIIGKEQKIFIIWFKTLELLMAHIKANPNDIHRIKQVEDLASVIMQYGEDKKYSLLNVIGLGEKSPYSLPFRVCCRLLASFILVQFGPNYRIRSPNEPIQISKQVATQLANSVKGEYQIFAAVVKTAQGFLSDPTKQLFDHLPNYVFLLTSRLFPDNKFFTNIT